MFEIGQQLAEQRRRRSLSLADCEDATKIRAKFLAALEDDRIDGLPDPAYGRIFLRDYARFLGLDADALVTEFDERHDAVTLSAEHQLVPPDPPERGQRARLGSRLADLPGPRPGKLVWLGIGAVLALGVLVWLGETRGPGPTPAHISIAPTSIRPARAPAILPPVHPAPTTLVLTGSGTAGSYVMVRAGDSTGVIVYEGTLAAGSSERLQVSQPLWMRVGWTPRLQAVLGGRALALSGGTADFTVTRTGITAAS